MSYLAISQLRALPVAPHPFEVQNTTRSLAFVSGETLPCLQDSGVYTLHPLSCWAPLLSTARTMSLHPHRGIRNPTAVWDSPIVNWIGRLHVSPRILGRNPPSGACKQTPGLDSTIPIRDLPLTFKAATGDKTDRPYLTPNPKAEGRATYSLHSWAPSLESEEVQVCEHLLPPSHPDVS